MNKNDINQVFLETSLESWDDIFRLNQRFLAKFVFRGQIKEDWGLSTSLERQINRHFPNLVDKAIIPLHEKEMIKEFQWKYPLYSTTSPDQKNIIEWLTIMQHFGSATRLLDFSYSIFVAIYMAVADNGENGVLWAINKVPIELQIFEKYRELKNVKSAGRDMLNQFTLEIVNDILLNHSFEPNIKKQIFIIEPQICNERLSRQQGLFLMPSDVRCSFSDCLLSYLHSSDPFKIRFQDLISYSHDAKYKQDDISIIKIVIPNRLNFKIMKYLRAMNVTTEILFPGLEGLAKSINYARFNFDANDE